jgi:muconate cycloisomerase
MDLAVKGYPYAKTAVDEALYDIKGRALGVPVYELLGGLYREEIPVAHSLGWMEYEEATSEAAAAVAEGIKTIKIKVGRSEGYDVGVVRQVRDTIGDEVDIVVDANQGWPTPKYAIRVLRQMEEYGIRYAEQPVEGIARMAQVAQAVDVPIMADESAWTPQDVLEIAERRAADMISLYTTKPGGLFKAKKVAAVAEAAGLPLNVNGSHETGVGNAANLHLVASTAAVTEAGVFPVTTIEGDQPTEMAGKMYLDDIVTRPFVYRDGHLVVPSTPGLGIELDEDKVDKYRAEG